MVSNNGDGGAALSLLTELAEQTNANNQRVC